MAIEIEKYIGDSELSEEPKKKIGFKLNKGSVKMEHLSEGVISNMIRVFKPYIDEAISGYVETDPTVQPWAKNIIWAGGQPYGTNIQNPYNTLWFDHIFGVNVTGNQHAIGLKVEGNGVSNSDFITKIIAESSGDYAIHNADDRSLLTANVISSLINETIESSGAYILPDTGIPSSDLDSTVQQALQMASTAAPQANTYTKSDVYNKNETYSKQETYTQSETNGLITNLSNSTIHFTENSTNKTVGIRTGAQIIEQSIYFTTDHTKSLAFFNLVSGERATVNNSSGNEIIFCYTERWNGQTDQSLPLLGGVLSSSETSFQIYGNPETPVTIWLSAGDIGVTGLIKTADPFVKISYANLDDSLLNAYIGFENVVNDLPKFMVLGVDSSTRKVSFYGKTMADVFTIEQVINNLKIGVQVGVTDDIYDPGTFSEADIRYFLQLVRVVPDWQPGKDLYELHYSYEGVGTTICMYLYNDEFYLDDYYHTRLQPYIDDLDNIRSGSEAGTTAYQKPNGGIPKTHLASGVQTSLGKADSALQTETDPTVPQHVKAITAANIVDWNAKGTYTKPVSGIPLSDLDNGVKSSLAKADEAVQPADIEDFLTEDDVVPVEFQDENKVKIATIAGQDIWAPAEVEAASVDIPVASSDTLGGIKIGYSTTDNSNNRAVQLSNQQKAYVRVPDATKTSRGLMVATDKELLSDLDDSRLLEKYAYETWLTSTPGTFVCTDVVDSGNPYSTQSNDYFDCNIMNFTYTTEYGVQKYILDAILDENHKKPFRIFRFVFGHSDNTADISYIAVRLYHQEYNIGTKDGVDNALLDVTYETYLIEGNVRISGSGNNVVVAVNPSVENNTINRYSMTVTYYHGEVYTITYNDLTSEKIIDDVAVLKSKDFVTKADYDILADQLAALTQNTTSEAVVTTETNAVKVKLVTLKDFEEETPITDYPRMIGVSQNQFVVNQIYPEKHSQFNYIGVNYSGQAQFLIPTAQELTGHIDYDQTKLQYYDGVGYVVTPVDGAYLTIGNSLDPTTNKMPAGSYRYIFTDISNSSRQLAYRTCYLVDESSSTKVIVLSSAAGSADISIDNLPKYWESYPSDWGNKRSGFVINEISDDTWFDFKTYTQAEIATASNGMLTDIYSFHFDSISTTFRCVYTANTSDKYRYTYITTDDFIGLILIQRPA